MDQAKAFLSSPVHKEHLSLLFSGIFKVEILDHKKGSLDEVARRGATNQIGNK
jgi:hypothetical protein